MKTRKIEKLLGGPVVQNLSHDAAIGLNSLARRYADKSEEDELFTVALRRANEEDLRKLARFRLDSEESKHLD